MLLVCNYDDILLSSIVTEREKNPGEYIKMEGRAEIWVACGGQPRHLLSRLLNISQKDVKYIYACTAHLSF